MELHSSKRRLDHWAKWRVRRSCEGGSHIRARSTDNRTGSDAHGLVRFHPLAAGVGARGIAYVAVARRSAATKPYDREDDQRRPPEDQCRIPGLSKHAHGSEFRAELESTEQWEPAE